MKKIIYFLMCIGLVALFSSCDQLNDLANNSGNDNNDSGNKTYTATDFPLWEQVTYDGDSYDVVKNSFVEKTEPTSGQEKKLTVRYENDEVRDYYLEDFLGITDCIILFSKTTDKKETTNGSKTLIDRYKVLDRNGKYIALFDFVFLLSDSDFSNLSPTKIRYAYNPTRIQIQNIVTETTLDNSKKKEMNFPYNSNGTVNFNESTKTIVYVNPMYINETDKHTKFASREEFSNNSGYLPAYSLVDVIKGSHIANFRNNKVYAYGNGMAAENKLITDSSVFLGNAELRISDENGREVIAAYIRTSGRKSNGNYTIYFYTDDGTVEIYKDYDSDITTSDNFNISNTLSTYEDGFLKGCFSVKNWTPGNLPKTVMLGAPFSVKNSDYQKYAVVPFVYNEANQEYEPDIQTWIDTYKADYMKIYNANK